MIILILIKKFFVSILLCWCPNHLFSLPMSNPVVGVDVQFFPNSGPQTLSFHMASREANRSGVIQGSFYQ